MLSIEIISAGAGSGKTYTLTERMVDLLQSGVRPSGILATTFTKKAAAELQERVRIKLLACGMTEAANELGEALIGTVHSIGVRLLQRFAFEAGVSPIVEIIAEGDGQRLFNESLSQVLSEQRIERMNALADRLGLNKKSISGTHDWRWDIKNLTELARSNNFSREVLEASKKRSWESFEALLPPVSPESTITWNNRLSSALDQAIAALEANEADSTKLTQSATEDYRNIQNQLRHRGELYWHEWAKIAKISPAAKSKDLVENLKTLALSHDSHQGFRDDVRAYIELVFDIAVDALEEFALYKKKRGLIDYSDMETSVRSLLRTASVRNCLREELDLLLVDEFQDTSPIQLDIFLELSRLAKRSIWVGDPKQSIYGFRGAEPALMQAIIDATGGIKEENILKKSWRSRPDLVYAVNHIFTKAFAHMPAEQVVLQPARKESAAEKQGSALIHWHFRSDLDEKKTPAAPWQENCIADQLRIFLSRNYQIYDKKSANLRTVKAGDIAILCRNNQGCQSMAEALNRCGLSAGISRAGLLETAEAKLVVACLKYLLSPADALSIAEILLLSGAMGLEAISESRLRYLQRQQTEPQQQRWGLDNSMIQQLYAFRGRTADLSAAEILNYVLESLDLRRLAASWDNPEQRLDNMDRLRKYALDYEQACNRLHSAASIGGFLLWLDELAQEQRDEQGAGESEDTIRVLTYHRSKGLEYPVSICHSLDQPLKEQIWGLSLVAENEIPDLNNILGGRWIRFWVNPYADQLGKTALEERLLQTPEWAKARQSALEEEARLLYVGLTRARDYLILPTTGRGTKWLNRVFNQGDESIPTLDPHSNETPFYRDGNALQCQTELLYKPKDFPESVFRERAFRFHAPPSGQDPRPQSRYYVDVHKEWPLNAPLQTGEPIAWGSWLGFQGEYSPELGNCVYGFLLSDRRANDREKRLRNAQHQINLHAQEKALNPELLLSQSEALQAFVASHFAPLATPVIAPRIQGFDGVRCVATSPDWQLTTETAVIFFKFAPFAEGMKKWKSVAQALAPELLWCKRLADLSQPRKNVHCLLVFPFEGQAVEVL